ncbi:uncharacterized protein LOC117226320 isoform X1 [Megalopta genalis]|uniref:uncharacterized protein LOC117226320 isoform X1 n=1 Tax=Megalopta genalis TaxID=115081 RepID=UPI003FCFBBDA
MSSSSDSSDESEQLNSRKADTKNSCEKVKKHVKHRKKGSKHNEDSKDKTAGNFQNLSLVENTGLQTKMSSEKYKAPEKRILRSEKHKSDAKDKVASNNAKKKEDKKEKSKYCSDSKIEVPKKHTEKKVYIKKHVTLKPSQSNVNDLDIEEADPSSSQEFQKSKISFSSSKFMKTFSRIREDCTPSTEKQLDGKTRISKEQSLHFKSNVIKILNKFKEVCSEYELQMEHVKWKHFKKELLYQESANNVIQKSKNVINKLKMELDDQENKLMSFSEEWNKKCCAQNIDHNDSSSSDKETLEAIEAPDTSNSSKKTISSEEDNTDCSKTFSENEVIEAETEKNKEGETSLAVANLGERGNDNNENTTSLEDNKVASSILSSNKKKLPSNDPNTKGKPKIIDELVISEKIENLRNDSSQDLFEESMIEDDGVQNSSKKEQTELEKPEILTLGKNSEEISAKIDLNRDDASLEGNKLNTEPDDEEFLRIVVPKTDLPEENAPSKTDDSESVATVIIERDTKVSSDELDEEEAQAKKALLDSDSETVPNSESASEKSDKVSSDLNSKEKLQTEQSKSGRRGRMKKARDIAIKKNKLSYNSDDITELCAKHALLDSNSDDSMGSSSTKAMFEKTNESDDNSKNRQAKASLLDSSNSECSSTDDDDDDSLQLAKVGTSSKNQKTEDGLESLQDEILGEFDPRLSEKVKKKPHELSNKCEADKKLGMRPCIVLKRLPENDVEKYAGALEKSRQHLEYKQIKSLINLDSLRRNTRKTIDSSPSSTFKKSKATTETEETLLDHLKKVENGELAENVEEDAVVDNENTPMKVTSDVQSNEDLMMEADRIAKNMLLNFDDSDFENQNVASPPGSNDEEKKEETSPKDNEKKLTKKSEKKCAASDEDAAEKREKSMWKRNKLLTMKYSSSDSEIETAKWNKKQEKMKQKAGENQTENSDADVTVTKRKRRLRRKILDSDSDIQLVDSDSDSNKSVTLESAKSSSDTDSMSGKKQKKTRKRKGRKSSDTDSSIGEKKAKPKRKRIKKVDTDSDDDSDNEGANSQGTPGKKGRKNIRKVMKDKQVADDTKQAAKEEEERLQRIADRQKLYNEMYEARLASEEKVEKLVLDFNTETKEELVSVHPNIVKRLKPHQAEGIKFMWDACFESLERIKSSSGSGCIIAHCMGLGKSLQVIALLHTLLNHEETGINRITIVCPLSTVLNWYNEFNLWLEGIEDHNIEVYELTKLKKNIERKYQLQSWYRTGGVLLIGYEMFRNLTGTNNKMRKAMKEEVLRYLIDPGPDLIVCDEGHLLKNEDTALSKSMKRIKTLRRIVLTGTPLQNNLTEYHCMVQFVKPNLLGTKKEFLNRFANPINNGQYDDSTEYDVKLMKKRAYVLHKMLKGCVQRFDYSVLTPFLPPKQEYVIFVRLSDVQIKMYRYYLDNLARRQRSANGSLFSDFQSLQRIWTHPYVMRLNSERVEKMNEKKHDSDSEGSLRDFIDDDSDSNLDSSSSNSSNENNSADSAASNAAPRASRSTRSTNPDIETIAKPEEIEKKEETWWSQFIESDHYEDMSISSKLMLLFGILKECEQIGDKVLVFSQSLYSLTLIEKFLGNIDDETQKGENSEYMGYRSNWSLGLDYFRLDGQTSPENRSIWCKIFNSPKNTRARLFLISTRAGGLGINLTAANRVIIFDASWNPSYDVQSIFRVYRFGQKKPCYVYRFLAAGTMEEKIYNRQVTKLSLSCRVVDEQQIERHYRNNDLNELYTFEPNTEGERPTLNLPKDRLLAEIFLKYKDYVENYHEHDSLLENKAEEELNEEERKQAWLEYEEEKKGKPMIAYTGAVKYPISGMLNQFNNVTPWQNVNNDYEKLQELIRKDYPNATPEYQKLMTTRVLTDMYSYWERQAFHDTTNTFTHTQMTNIIRMPSTVRNINNISGQDTRTEIPFTYVNSRSADPKYGDDDEVVEVIPTTTSGKSKNQEE